GLRAVQRVLQRPGARGERVRGLLRRVGPGEHAAAVRHEHHRLWRYAERTVAGRQQARDGPGCDERVVGGVLGAAPKTCNAAAREDAYNAEPLRRAVGEDLDAITDADLQRTGKIAADGGLTGRGRRSGDAGRVRVT